MFTEVSMNRIAIEDYRRGMGLISYAIGAVTPHDLAERPGPGDWSIAQVVIHLMDKAG